MSIPEQKFLVIRRGPVFWEVRFREESDSKFKTTKIPVKETCRGSNCKFCRGIAVQGTIIRPPLEYEPIQSIDAASGALAFKMRRPFHKIIPQLAAHLVAFEWGEQHPNVPFTVAWLLTSEEVEAGRTGVPDALIP